MEDSILISVKKALGIQKDLDAFDQDILMSINSVFSILYQIGVISSAGTYRIENETTRWDELFGTNPVVLDMIKTYTYIKVRIIFDPPSSSFVLDSLKAQAQELEWRIHIQSDSPDSFDDDNLNHNTLTDDEILNMWKDMLGSNQQKPDTMFDEDIKAIWDDVMSQKGGE